MDFKALKKAMSEVFENIKTPAEQGQLPALADCEKFERLCRTMQAQAADDWVTDAEDFTQLSSQLVLAVKKNQVAESVLIAESLDDAQNYCHRSFKD